MELIEVLTRKPPQRQSAPSDKMYSVSRHAELADTREPSTSTSRSNETAIHPSGVNQAGDSHTPAPDSAHRVRQETKPSACEHKTGSVGRWWGRAGELFAASKLGLCLCRDYTQGHDGRMGNNLVEIKTITPWKRRPFVRGKRSGNFNLLAVVRFYSSGEAELRLIRRSRLPKGNGGTYFGLSWSRACALAEPGQLHGVRPLFVDSSESGNCEPRPEETWRAVRRGRWPTYGASGGRPNSRRSQAWASRFQAAPRRWDSSG